MLCPREFCHKVHYIIEDTFKSLRYYFAKVFIHLFFLINASKKMNNCGHSHLDPITDDHTLKSNSSCR